MARRFSRLSTLALLLGGFTAMSFFLSRSGGADEEDPARRFSLVYNVNNAGYIDVCGCKRKEVRQGSLTRRSSFLRQLRTTGREVLLLDGGSALYPINEKIKPEEMPEAQRKAALIVEAYNRMGYAAMAVGPHDLVGGLDHLLELRKAAKFKMLSANLADADGKLYFDPHTVIEVAGVRVGVFGLTLDTIPRPYLQKWAPGAQILEPLAAAEKAYSELRDRSDLVVALAYLREESNFELVERLKTLEVLIDPYLELGSQKTWLHEEDDWVAMKGDSVFLRSDGQGARLGIVDIELRTPDSQLRDGSQADKLRELVEFGEATDAQKAELADLSNENLFRFTRVSLEPHHLTDPDIDQLIEQWKLGGDPSKAKHLETELPLRDQFLTTSGCEGCHAAQTEFWKGTGHAHAYETLKKTNDHRRFDCIGCHTLGYGLAFLDRTDPGPYRDVQCESCHGTKPEHAKAPKENPFPRIAKENCLVCHNQEQTRTEFQFTSARRRVACPKG